MNYKIVIIDEAKIDFRESLFWYKNVDPKLAKRFHLSFKESLEIIKKNPFHFQIFKSAKRSFLSESETVNGSIS